MTTSGKFFDGVAVVSDIVASLEPLIASERLKALVDNFRIARKSFSIHDIYTPELIKEKVGDALKAVRDLSPLAHQVNASEVLTASCSIAINVCRSRTRW